jgi:hypothetical protein
MGAQEASELIGCFIQLETEPESLFRLLADCPPLILDGSLVGLTIASKPFPPLDCSCSKATHSHEPELLPE